ncbi:MAG: hypothetical protein WED00_16475 [Aquisalimonadaceae bacterium]
MRSRPEARPTRFKEITRKAVVRAVASSTAIETGQPVSRIEARLLRASDSRFKDLSLA